MISPSFLLYVVSLSASWAHNKTLHAEKKKKTDKAIYRGTLKEALSLVFI